MSSGEPLRLGVNVDHVGTVRNARGGVHPDPVAAARVAAEAGADGITMHLREDRRHILDKDVYLVKEAVDLPLNFEMAPTDEMVEIALDLLPNACCLVPEKREERTTEGGLDVAGQQDRLAETVAALQGAGIRVSLFVEAVPAQLEAARGLGADIVELHTGAYADLVGEQQRTELAKIADGAALASKFGIECHAGHGLSYANVTPIARLPQVVELNIGHFLIGEAIYVGLPTAIVEMRRLMEAARA